MNAEAELADLHKRFALLEGERKSYYETSKWAIKQNKETVAQVRKENKDLRKALSQMVREREDRGEPNEREIQNAEASTLRSRHQYDDLRSQILQREQRIKELQGVSNDVEKQTVGPQTDTPIHRQLRSLENRLDKAYIKYNEAMSIKKTYEQIVKRLKEERLTFDSQLAAVENTLKAKEQDYLELLHLLHDANHAKEIAKMELSRYESALEEERRMREKEIQDRRNMVKQQAQLHQKQEDRDRRRKDIIMEAWGDAHDEKQPKAQSAKEQQDAHKKAEEDERRISTFEEAFRKIKEATGVGDINDVLEKFMTAEDTYKNLLVSSQECQAKLDRLHDEKARLKTMADELKFAGGAAAAQSNRRAVDDMESRITEGTSVLNRSNQKYNRVARILINVKAGVEHLVDKLDAIRVDVGPYSPTEDIVVDLLTLSEQKIVKLIELIQSRGGAGMLAEALESSVDLMELVAPQRSTGSISGSSMRSVPAPAPLTENNIRIKINSGGDDDLPVTDSEDEGLQEEVLDRNVLKKQASLMEDKQKRKAKKTTTKRKATTAAAAAGPAQPAQPASSSTSMKPAAAKSSDKAKK